MRRFAGYWNPDEHFQGAGWHVKQFQFSMAHGGLFGSEWGGALWSNAYLPLAHSDSAFAAIVESGGLAGGMLVITGCLAIAWFFRRIALRTEDEAARTFIFCNGGHVHGTGAAPYRSQHGASAADRADASALQLRRQLPARHDVRIRSCGERGKKRFEGVTAGYFIFSQPGSRSRAGPLRR